MRAENREAMAHIEFNDLPLKLGEFRYVGFYLYIYIINYSWLVVSTPLKNMSSSVGMMKFPIYGKIKNVPNHQPAYPHDIHIGWLNPH